MSQKNNEESNPAVLSRRKFGQKASLAGVAAILSANGAKAFPAPAPGQDSVPRTPDEMQSAELEIKYRRVMLHYGDRLTAEQQARIRKILQFNEKMMQLIREFHLENGQGTATTLKLCPDPAVLLAEGAPNPEQHGRKN